MASQKLKANQVRCQSWVFAKMKAVPDSITESEYRRLDGSILSTVDIAFDNGMVFQVSESRFWLRKKHEDTE